MPPPPSVAAYNSLLDRVRAVEPNREDAVEERFKALS